MATKKTKKEYTNTPTLTEVKKNQLDVSGTFMIVNIEEKWRIGIANRWMTNKIFNTAKEAEEYIQSKPWDLIMNLAGTIAEYVKNNN